MSFGYVVTEMLLKTIDFWLIFDQDLKSFFPGELDGFAGWHLSPSLIDEFALFLRVKGRVEAQEFVTFHEVPVELDPIVGSFIENIVRYPEERTLDGGHKGTTSSD